MHPLNQKLIELLPDLKELTFGENAEYVNAREKEPTLSDVLRAVYRTMTEMTRHDGEKQEAILSMLKWYVTPEGDVREPMWNLSLGLNDQPESTKQFILSILNK